MERLYTDHWSQGQIYLQQSVENRLQRLKILRTAGRIPLAYFCQILSKILTSYFTLSALQGHTILVNLAVGLHRQGCL